MADPGWKRAGYSVAAMRELARRTLPRPVFDFADGAAEDERTLRRNESAWQEIDLVPRPLNGTVARDLSVDLFGRRLALPVIIGPTGLSGLFWPGGELAAARAAASAGTAFCLSHASVCRLEDVPRAGDSPRWMQVFVYREREFTETQVPARAEALARLDEAVALFRRVVESLPEERFSEPHPDAQMGTVANALVRLVAHFALHRGQMSYIARLVNPAKG